MIRSLHSGALVTLLVVAATVAGSQSAAQVNLLVNPGFEDAGGSYDGWFTFGDGVQLSLPGGDNIIRTGAAASKTYGEFTGCPGSPQFDVGGFGQAFTPTPGMDYVFSGFSFVSSGDPIPGADTCSRNRMLAKIVFFDAPSGGFELSSNEVIIGDGNSPLDVWFPFTVSAPAPAGAQRVEALFLFLQPACDEGAVFVDDTSFNEVSPTVEPNLLVNSSFDTGLDGWNPFGNVFHDNRSFAVRTPTGSAKMFSTFMPEFNSGMYQSFAASPGSAWKMDIHSMTTCVEDPITGTNDNMVIARVVFRDAANEEIGSAEKVILDASSPLGEWTWHTVLALDAPPGTVAVEPFVLFVSPTQLDGAVWVDDVSFQELNPIGVGEQGTVAPLALELHPNVPNPFNPSTRIGFDLPEPGAVGLSVYDVAGRLVATLLQAELEAGTHQVTWNGTTTTGTSAAAGVYRYVLETPMGRVSRSMTLIK